MATGTHPPIVHNLWQMTVAASKQGPWQGRPRPTLQLFSTFFAPHLHLQSSPQSYSRSLSLSEIEIDIWFWVAVDLKHCDLGCKYSITMLSCEYCRRWLLLRKRQIGFCTGFAIREEQFGLFCNKCLTGSSSSFQSDFSLPLSSPCLSHYPF